MTAPDLTDGELALLRAGLSDDIALGWALHHLGLIDIAAVPLRPSEAQLGRAFDAFGRLTDADLVRVGDLVAVADDLGGPTPTEVVAVPLPALRAQVDEAVAGAAHDTDWAFACWTANTDAGDARAAEDVPPG